jgi:hypothetical protein
VTSALAMGLPLLVLVLAGHPRAAVYAAFGAFTGLYCNSLPYRQRATALAVVGAAFLAAVTLGSAAAMVLAGWWWVAAVAVVAAAAKVGCDAGKLGPPGAWMFLFAFAAVTQVPTRPSDVPLRVLVAAAGAAVAWCVVMLGALHDPGGPERRATATALATTAQVIDLGHAATPNDWHRAHAALKQAERYVGSAPPTAGRRLLRILYRAEGLLTDAVVNPGDLAVAARVPRLRRTAAALRSRTRWQPQRRTLRRRSAGHGSRNAAPEPVLPAEVRALRAGHRRHLVILSLLNGARVLLGAGVAGAAALLFGLGHPYWAPISAAAVLQATHVRMTWHRSLQRGLGTAGGLLVGALLLESHPGPLAITGLVVLMQLGIEMFISHNYAIAVLFITPVTMLLSELLRPSPTRALLVDRGGGVVVGIIVGLAAALLVVHPRAALALRHAVERCHVAIGWVTSGGGPQQTLAAEELRDALIELRTAEETARGETWPAGISPSAVAALENRAYRALATQRQTLRASELNG